MNNLPFRKPGRFYRGNIHCHSTRSDGKRTPEQVVDDYRSRGYDFLSLTDHFLPNSLFRPGEHGSIPVTDTRHLAGDDFVTIPGAEIHGPGLRNGAMWHLVAVGLPLDFPESPPEETGVEVARRAFDAGAFVGLAHPYWNAVSETDARSVVDVIHAVEIYNHAAERTVRRGFGEHLGEVLLATDHRLTFYAADDAHFGHRRGTFHDAFGGWVQVKAESLTEAALLAALKAGEFYSSTGPEIHDIAIEDGNIRVACSPVDSIVVSGRGPTFRRADDRAMTAFEAQLPDPADSPYVRVTVVDDAGRLAWSNAIWSAERS